MIQRIRRAAAVMLLALITCSCLAAPRPAAAAKVPLWPSSSVIYCVYTSIFSPQQNFAGVTAQLGRLKNLGVTVIWLMPVTPIGQPYHGHPAFDSPYSVENYYAVSPAYGTDADLHTLIAKAHSLGLKVILDEVLNHTAWDNALITQHPQYYVHSNGNPNDPASIVRAFTYNDVAQLNYKNHALWAYMSHMLKYWITTYKIDGFRFDTADDPDGPNRMIPAAFWQYLGPRLRHDKPNILLLGEEQTPALALKPFSLDYAWQMYGALKAGVGGDASQVETTWQKQTDNFPIGMRHMSVQDDWDMPRDVNVFGGDAGAMAVAAFNFTNTGVPLVYNGMEIGNTAEAVNPHTPINWSAGNPSFPSFYHDLIALRRQYSALQQGNMTWLPNTVPAQVLTYERSGTNNQFLIEINLSSTAANGAFHSPIGKGWKEVSLPGMQTVDPSADLTQIALQPKGFAIFQRSLDLP